MGSPSAPHRPAGTFIAIVAALIGVIVTSLVQPATNDAPLHAGTTAKGPIARGDIGGTDEEAAPADTSPVREAGSRQTSTAQAGSRQTSTTQKAVAGGPTVGDGEAGSAPTTATAAGKVRGVTPDIIKIGVAVVDLGPLEPVLMVGDIRGHVESVIDGFRRDGLLPVHGREVALVFEEFQVLRAEEQRSACVSFAQDHKVFLVIAPLLFPEGAECLAREFQIPVISAAGNVPGDQWFARTHPWAFYTSMSDTRVGVNWMHWAHDNGLLQGKTIGLNYPDDAATVDRVQRAIKDTLHSLGHKVAVDFPSPDGSVGLAVQRFRAAGVNLALAMGATPGAGSRLAQFTHAAERQGYRPDYTASEFIDTSSLGPGQADMFEPNQFDGTLAMTYYRRAEDGQHGNPPIPRAGVACEEQYERYSGKEIDRVENANEWDAVQHACDQGRAVITALHHAGRGLTPIGFVQAMETAVRNQASGEHGDISFFPTKHYGVDQVKAMRWSRKCTCWLHASEFRPLYVR